MKTKPFYGWWVTAAAICTFGIAVGIPYYNMPFFYDYYEKTTAQGGFGWSRDQITLGFPLAALFTLWVGPVLVHRFSPRKLILIGTALTAIAFGGFSRMAGDLTIYYVFWFLYTVGYIFSGPIPHQVIISQWFRKKRGRAMGITYVGVAVFGSLGSYIVKPLTESLGFRGALAVMGGMMFLAWPLALFIIRDRPAEKGLHPDNDPQPLAVPVAPPQSMGSMLAKPAFWLLVVGSLCSIGSIGAINQHMKLVFKDHGFVDQTVLNSTWRTASILILWSSIAGRLLVGWMADRYPKKYVMTGTYALVAATIPLLLLVKPGQLEYLYFFAILFGFGMGADYMLIPLMAAEQFGVNTLARAMAIILPADTIGQTWFPYFVSLLRRHFGDYEHALLSVFALAAIGAVAIALLPKYGRQDDFTYKNLSELRRSAEQLGARHVRFEEDTNEIRKQVSQAVVVGGRRVGNALAIHPMEGCDSTPDGRPDELTWRRYQRFAAGGAKLLWFEATAVREDGRANVRQLWINRDTVSDFARLLEAIVRTHRERWGGADDLLIPVQLTHSGRYSVPTRSIMYHNPFIDKKSGTPADYPVITDGELERLEDDYVSAARLTVEAGFRAIDLKVTHGYLLSEMTGAKSREGRYGGPLENRLRFIGNVIGKIRAALGSQLLICMRLGCFDSVPYFRDASGVGIACDYPTPYPYGFGVDPHDPLREDLTEVKQAIAQFRDWGVALLNVSLGCPYYNPHVGRPFEKPDDGNYDPPEHPMAGVDRHFRISGELQRAFPDLPMVGTGYSWLQKYAINAGARNLAEGNIRFVGIGRGALAYPDFAADALDKGDLDERRVCKTLTFCTYLMRQKNHPLGQFPTGCPPFDKEGYGEIMKEARASQRQGH